MIELLPKFRRGAPRGNPDGEANDAIGIFDRILRAAAREGASDAHFEPKERVLLVRFRVDGAMQEHASLPSAKREAVIARGKIFGGMDITEKRLPQDGRAVLEEGGKRFHLRLSTLPTVHGENLVIRFLDQTMPALTFEKLGMLPAQIAALQAAINGPAGLIYLTGPTGSGKTTTLHAALHALDHRDRVIHTLEQPVEYEFPSIRQTEIREQIGFTFATALRSLLRQNPNIILVGETRDEETAQLAVGAALTGHQVLSTLHTNDALTAIPRLCELGVKPFLLAASLRLVAAQRLVRKLCPQCREIHPECERLALFYGRTAPMFCRAVGCAACQGRGYKGRVAIHEVVPTKMLGTLVAANAPLAELVKAREAAGIMTLEQHGVALAAEGLTTIEEIARVL